MEAVLSARAEPIHRHGDDPGHIFEPLPGVGRDGMDYNLAYMSSDFAVELKEPFDTVDMNALFERGYEMAVKGYPWAKVPPGFTVPEIEPPLPPAPQ
jgi:hypothetical protein